MTADTLFLLAAIVLVAFGVWILVRVALGAWK